MIQLQRYALHNAPQVAHRVRGLIEENKNWLDTVRPNVSEGYAEPMSALKSISRIALDNELNAYVIRRDKVAVGIATAISNQVIAHPDVPHVLFEGTDIDYWVTPKSGLEKSDHRTVIERLVVAENKRADERWFAALTPAENAVAIGIDEPPFDRFREPAPILTPQGDPYNIAKGGVDLQMYWL